MLLLVFQSRIFLTIVTGFVSKLYKTFIVLYPNSIETSGFVPKLYLTFMDLNPNNIEIYGFVPKLY